MTQPITLFAERPRTAALEKERAAFTSPDYAQKYRIRLLDAGVISGAGRGYVEFAVPYLAEYLRKQRDE